MSEKIKKITVYVENKGKGKATIVDSRISVQKFPAKNDEGKQTIGPLATKVVMPETVLKGFQGMVDVHYPHQLKVLSEAEYKAAKDRKPEPVSDDQTEKLKEQQLYESAMKGGDDEILAYLDAYPDLKGEHGDGVRERYSYLDAKVKNTKKSYGEFLGKYPKGPYIEEIKALLNKAK